MLLKLLPLLIEILDFNFCLFALQLYCGLLLLELTRKPSIEVESTTLEGRTRQITKSTLRCNVHPRPKMVIFILWPWTMDCEFDLRICRQRQGEPAFQICRSII